MQNHLSAWGSSRKAGLTHPSSSSHKLNEVGSESYTRVRQEGRFGWMHKEWPGLQRRQFMQSTQDLQKEETNLIWLVTAGHRENHGAMHTQAVLTWTKLTGNKVCATPFAAWSLVKQLLFASTLNSETPEHSTTEMPIVPAGTLTQQRKQMLWSQECYSMNKYLKN